MVLNFLVNKQLLSQQKPKYDQYHILRISEC